MVLDNKKRNNVSIKENEKNQVERRIVKSLVCVKKRSFQALQIIESERNWFLKGKMVIKIGNNIKTN